MGVSVSPSISNTELADAILAADAMANPTVPQVLSHLLLWNGTTWDRAKSINTGQIKNTLYSSSGVEVVFPTVVGATITANADFTSNTADQDRVVSRGEKFNGSSWVRDVTLVDATLKASAATTSNGNSGDQLNQGHRGVLLFINIGAVTGTTPKLYIGVQYKDPVSGNYFNILNNFGAEYTAADASTLKVWAVYPAALNGHSASVDSMIPRSWRVEWQLTGTSPNFTFSIGASLLI